MDLVVMTLEGKKFSIHVGKSCTARDLRQQIAAAIHSPPYEVRVAYAGHELDCNSDQLFYPKPDVSVVHVVRRMLGGSPGEHSGQAVLELSKQFRHILKHPLPGISVGPSDEDPLVWYVKLMGPKRTPYEGGWFDVKLQFSTDFPRIMPEGCFLTPIWHPNVGSTGHICIQMARDSDDSCAVECVLVALHMLLATPNPDSPRNHTCARQYKVDHEQYISKARQMTRESAMGCQA